ncbi:hypothetical protein [Reyranella sp.]|uniref:hypothetical protein n=1 Tax=Reyranella sp. TaxID=1929291 RepID=UPI004035B2A7
MFHVKKPNNAGWHDRSGGDGGVVARPIYSPITKNRYASDRMRSSLDRVVGEAPTGESALRAMLAKAREEHDVVVFKLADLRDWDREIVRRIHSETYPKQHLPALRGQK